MRGPPRPGTSTRSVLVACRWHRSSNASFHGSTLPSGLPVSTAPTLSPWSMLLAAPADRCGRPLNQMSPHLVAREVAPHERDDPADVVAVDVRHHGDVDVPGPGREVDPAGPRAAARCPTARRRPASATVRRRAQALHEQAVTQTCRQGLDADGRRHAPILVGWAGCRPRPCRRARGCAPARTALLRRGPLLPVRRERVTVALEAAAQPHVVRRLHPHQHRPERVEPGCAAADALEHEQRHRLDRDGLGELAGQPVVAPVAPRPPLAQRPQESVELLVDAGEPRPPGEQVVHVQQARPCPAG